MSGGPLSNLGTSAGAVSLGPAVSKKPEMGALPNSSPSFERPRVGVAQALSQRASVSHGNNRGQGRASLTRRSLPLDAPLVAIYQRHPGGSLC